MRQLSIICLIPWLFLVIHSKNPSLKLVLIVRSKLIRLQSKPKSPERQVHRHGDRSPDFQYPNSPYNDDKYWPESYEMLTKKGKQRMYSIGQYLRRRYQKFLTYNPREVYIRSSGKDRCLESTALVLAGLYPPVGRWKWNSDLGRLWQPFPIQTVKYSEDGVSDS